MPIGAVLVHDGGCSPPGTTSACRRTRRRCCASAVAWVSNRYGLGIAPLNGIVAALVLAWVLGRRSVGAR